jgi:predicted PurR-regulated permease PerM/methylmalonyl-CoA mutase cobalamin-binding subunit
MTASPAAARLPRGVLFFFTVVAVVAVLHLAQDVFIPLALAGMLAFVLAPPTQWLERHGVNRALSVLATVSLALALLGGLTYVVANQFFGFVRDLPQYKENLKAKIQPLRSPMKASVEQTARTVQELGDELKKPEPARAQTPQPRVQKVEVIEPPPSVARILRNTFGPILKPLGTGAVVLVFLLFMLLERESLRDRLIRLLGVDLQRTTQALTDATQRVTRYLSMQTLINGVQGLLLAAGLWLIGVPNAILWGGLLIVLRFIPYIGPWVAAAFPVAMAIAVFEGWTEPLLTLGLVLTLELLSNNVLEPLLFGKGTGVSPLALLVAAVFWTWLWGGAGLFLAIPLTVTLAVLGKHVPQLAFFGILLGDQPVLQPRERFYQRLLARVPDEADEVIEETLGEQSLREVLDGVVFPALAMALRDHHRGTLEDGQRLYIVAHVDGVVEDLLQSAESARPGDEPARVPRVLCVPAHDDADEIGASTFARLLAISGIAAHALPLMPSRVEALELVERSPGACICVCAFAPTGLPRARQLCRALHERMPEATVLAALWALPEVPDRLKARFAAVGVEEVFATLGDGVPAVARALQEGGTKTGERAAPAHA